MKLKTIAAAAALLATQSFAFLGGIGGHYAPNFGTKLSASDRAPIMKTLMGDVEYDHGSFTNMQGFGFKLWLEILPIVDIEATFNIQFGSYDATLYVPGQDPVPLEIELAGTPFGKATPKYVGMNGDLTVTYPLTFIPVIRPYIGAGVTYYLNTFVMNSDFISKVFDGNEDLLNILTGDVSLEQLGDMVQNAVNPADRVETMKQSIQNAAKEEGLTQSIGGHVMLGLRAKLPIIPLAIYANGKYYFGGKFHDEITAGRFAVEVGGGLAL